MQTAPIILFTYNRLKHTRATVEALLHNKLAENSELIIFADAPSNEVQIEKVDEVKKFIKTIKGFRKIEIIERDKNYGLGENVIDGVTRVINQYGRAITLEDDLIISPYFLQFINEALNLYEENSKVISVHGYVYPVKRKLPETFFLKGADCLGWATWKRGWDIFERDGQVLLNKLLEKNLTKEFDYNNAYPYTQMLKNQIAGKNNSWAVRWYASAFINDLYTLYPGRSLVYHAGGDGSGVNTGFDNLLDVDLTSVPISVQPITVRSDASSYAAYSEFHYKMSHPPLLHRVRRVLRKSKSNFKNRLK